MIGRIFFAAVFGLSLVLLVAACAGPRSDPAVAGTPAATGTPAPATAMPIAVPVVAAPAPASPAIAAPPAKASVLHVASKAGDLACRTDADCVIKDVGSCCGYRPQCLNKAAKTFPDQVKAKCASEGRVSTCGMPAVAGCQCVQGKCAAQFPSDNSSLAR